MTNDEKAKAKAISDALIEKGYTVQDIAAMYAFKVVQYEKTDAYKYQKLYEDEKRKREELQARIKKEGLLKQSNLIRNKLSTIKNLMDELDIIRTDVLYEVNNYDE